MLPLVVLGAAAWYLSRPQRNPDWITVEGKHIPLRHGDGRAGDPTPYDPAKVGEKGTAKATRVESKVATATATRKGLTLDEAVAKYGSPKPEIDLNDITLPTAEKELALRRLWTDRDGVIAKTIAADDRWAIDGARDQFLDEIAPLEAIVEMLKLEQEVAHPDTSAAWYRNGLASRARHWKERIARAEDVANKVEAKVNARSVRARMAQIVADFRAQAASVSREEFVEHTRAQKANEEATNRARYQEALAREKAAEFEQQKRTIRDIQRYPRYTFQWASTSNDRGATFAPSAVGIPPSDQLERAAGIGIQSRLYDVRNEAVGISSRVATQLADAAKRVDDVKTEAQLETLKARLRAIEEAGVADVRRVYATFWESELRTADDAITQWQKTKTTESIDAVKQWRTYRNAVKRYLAKLATT